MKYFLLFVFLFYSLLSFAQVKKRKSNIISIKEIGTATKAENRVIGNGFHDDADAIAQGLHLAADKKILYLPQGTYLIKSSIGLYTSGLHIKGAGIGKTIITFDSSFKGNQALFEANGASNITIEGITFTGNAKRVKAVLEFNSYPNQCKNVQIMHCEFSNLWTDDAINFGGLSGNEVHSLDNLLIDHCRFVAICNPSYKTVTNDTDPKCVGINLQQTTLRANIQYCFFQNISGDGIFGWGWSQPNIQVNPYYGNWNIYHNFFTNCWMCVEVNGGGLGNGLNLHDNTMKCSTRNGGYLISVDSYKARVMKNNLYNVDRGLIEYTAIEGVISGNTGIITTYSKQSDGVPATEHLPRIACLELYGYNNLITRNHFTLDRKQPHQFSPSEFNGVEVIGKTTDTLTQPLAYKGITDYSAYWTIAQNRFIGFTHRAIAATGQKIRNVLIRNNVFSSKQEQASPIEIYGYNWQIISNTFNLTGSTPSAGNYVVKVFYLQTDKTESVVSSNKILDSNWNAAAHKYGAVFIRRDVKPGRSD